MARSRHHVGNQWSINVAKPGYKKTGPSAPVGDAPERPKSFRPRRKGPFSRYVQNVDNGRKR
ncbi:uncharacterized protein DAT39_023672, partial [Clarias magur]